MKIHNTNINSKKSIITPAELNNITPLTPNALNTVSKNRKIISKILKREMNKLLVIVGPCSINNLDSALDYASFLETQIKKFKNLHIVMRVYFEKPRTSVGWKGFINDPLIDESFNMNLGLQLARELMIKINEKKIGIATEFLDPIIPQYIGDLVSWGAIGARTTESQVHREMVSGLSCPIGFKNNTAGDIKSASDAMLSSKNPHVFLGIQQSGIVALYKSKGNSNTHIVLRGGKSPNYSSKHILEAKNLLREAGFHDHLIMIDCSHSNSQKVFKNQIKIVEELSEKLKLDSNYVKGIMLESNLLEGNQPISEDMVYGKSITDPCINLSDTEYCLQTLSESIK